MISGGTRPLIRKLLNKNILRACVFVSVIYILYLTFRNLLALARPTCISVSLFNREKQNSQRAFRSIYISHECAHTRGQPHQYIHFAGDSPTLFHNHHYIYKRITNVSIEYYTCNANNHQHCTFPFSHQVWK